MAASPPRISANRAHSGSMFQGRPRLGSNSSPPWGRGSVRHLSIQCFWRARGTCGIGIYGRSIRRYPIDDPLVRAGKQAQCSETSGRCAPVSSRASRRLALVTCAWDSEFDGAYGVLSAMP